MQVPVLKTCYRHTKMFIRSWLEYYGVAFHSSLTKQQESSLERCQAVCLRIILEESYISYSAALEMSGLKTLSSRRLDRCLQFSLKPIKHEQNKRMFPANPNLGNDIHIRNREQFQVNFARTNSYRNSAIPFCQRLLNSHYREKGLIH